jgi:hypothetical protein
VQKHQYPEHMPDGDIKVNISKWRINNLSFVITTDTNGINPENSRPISKAQTSQS